MKKQKILGGIQGLLALVMIGAVRIWAPVCSKMLELSNGRKVPMKCAYMDKVTMILSLLIIIVSILLFLAKKENKALLLVNLSLGVSLVLSYNNIIGVCMNPEMPCNQTKLWGMGIGSAIVILSIVGVMSNREEIPN